MHIVFHCPLWHCATVWGFTATAFNVLTSTRTRVGLTDAHIKYVPRILEHTVELISLHSAHAHWASPLVYTLTHMTKEPGVYSGVVNTPDHEELVTVILCSITHHVYRHVHKYTACINKLWTTFHFHWLFKSDIFSMIKLFCHAVWVLVQ